MDPDDSLADRADARGWTLSEGDAAGEVPVMAPDLLFLGRGDHALEVATARARTRPTATMVRGLWHRRHRNRPSPVVLVVAYPHEGIHRASVCGPVGEQPPVVGDVELAQVERLCAAALDEPNRHTAVRLLSAALPEVDTPMPGVRNAGMLATHELGTGVPRRDDWAEACERGKGLLRHSGRRLVEALGYGVEEHAANTSVLVDGQRRQAIAVSCRTTRGLRTPPPATTAPAPWRRPWDRREISGCRGSSSRGTGRSASTARARTSASAARDPPRRSWS